MGAPPSGFAGLASRFDLTKPLIAAVNGVAMGGGFEIALACDLIVASETAVFALPEPRVGLAALAGGLHRLPRAIGLKRAMGMILTGRRVSAKEGLELGFVNEVAAPGRADGRRQALGRPDRRVQPYVDPRLEAGGAVGPGRALARGCPQGPEPLPPPSPRSTARRTSSRAHWRSPNAGRRNEGAVKPHHTPLIPANAGTQSGSGCVSVVFEIVRAAGKKI